MSTFAERCIIQKLIKLNSIASFSVAWTYKAVPNIATLFFEKDECNFSERYGEQYKRNYALQVSRFE